MTASRFTAALIDGLSTGVAYLNGDGLITVDGAYDYVGRRLAEEGLSQSPRKWQFDASSDMVLARIPRATPTEVGDQPPVRHPMSTPMHAVGGGGCLVDRLGSGRARLNGKSAQPGL